MFGAPKIPGAPPPAPTAPSLSAALSNQVRTTFGQGKGSLGGTFITGPVGGGSNPMGNVPGSTGQSGMKTAVGT
jgi:hypothetical protein